MSSNNDNERKKKTLLLIGLIIVFTIILFVIYIRNNVFYSPLVLHKNISYSSVSEYFDDNIKDIIICDVIDTNKENNEGNADNNYYVIFLDENGNELQRYAIKQGDIPCYYTELSDLPKGFVSWDKEFISIYEDMTYNAIIHQHNYVDITVAPTCVKNGYTLHKCKDCGDEYTDNVISALGHDFKTQVHAATCLAGGYTKYECSVCGYSYTSNFVTKLGHDYITTTVSPSCLEKGYTIYKCSRCGNNYKDDYVSALGHDYVYSREEVKDTVNGVTEYYKVNKCSRCEDEIEEFNYVNFDYVENIQEYIILKNGIYKIEVWGAQGGGENGGKGAYAYGEAELHEGDILYVVVGGQGNKREGGYNGGGRGQKQAGTVSPSGYGGGGATHIALSSGLLYELEDHKEDILIVAGAGGGASESGRNGGAGGLVGEDGQGGTLNGKGGTQDSGGAAGDGDVEAGSFGKGGNNDGVQPKKGTWGSGGGGAGYYGGGASSWKQEIDNSSGGAGGSSYITGLENADVTSGNNEGNGKAKISFLSE